MKKITVVLLLNLFVSFRAESSNLPITIAKKAFETIRSVNKVYVLCLECKDVKAKILFMNERGIEPVSDGKNGYEYRFFVNKKQYIDILHLYFQSNEKWINLGIYSGLVNPSIGYELIPSQLPYDVEVEAELDFKTTSSVKPITVFEKKIVDEINLVRTKPSEYAKKLKERIPYYEGNIYNPPDRGPRQSREGVKGIENAILYLEKAEAQQPILFSEEISLAVQEYFKNRTQNSSRWKELRDRYGKYIKDAELVNILEAEFYGYNIASDLVAYILVSGGDRRFGFLNSIFDKEIRYIGLGCQTDSRYGYKCHITFSSGLAPEESIQKMQEDRSKVSNISYLSEFEKNVIEETNYLRTKPKEYATILKEKRKYYFNKIYKEPFRAPVNITEGISALEEAIQFLENVEPVSSLQITEELYLSARDHVNDSGSKGILGHYGSDGSSPQTRILRYKKNAKIAGENIDYGWINPRDVVISLLVDDGVADRGHRKNLFQKSFVYIGVACGYHRDYPLMCVQNFGAW